MGLGLEQWDLGYWVIYVIATTVMEAWLIGRWLGMTAGVSIATSVVANTFTGLMCGAAGLLAPFFHYAWAGSNINPNPLLNMLYILLGFALPSAIFEAFVWQIASYVAKPKKEPRFFRASLGAHIIGIPLAFLILLIPDRPYVGLEGYTSHFRDMYVKYGVQRPLELYINDNHRIPNAKNVDELLRI